ncbi:hypothetical protein NUW58_g755 [Xylaria curta]|uniref:Uncharacterized protein n=2 Tax=Xylaria curta TaxID=42375 RepID=A0ACC1PN69_9PEZI|nr:hypothetical protein NUW58_g2042 [Xylaria curta]KAJ2997131.1 hypothetical protein NUW58_g755 [Xylaria curta]
MNILKLGSDPGPTESHEPLLDEKGVVQKPNSPVLPFSGPSILKIALFLYVVLSSAALVVLGWNYNARPYSPVNHVLSYERQALYFGEDPKFTGLPGDVDEAWDYLLEPINIRITRDELEKSGAALTKDIVQLTGGDYVSVLSVHHELHCLGIAEFRVPGLSEPCYTWYKIFGDPSNATPMIVLHGGPGACHDYLLPLTDLSPSVPLIFYDQIGNGRSKHLPEKNGDEDFWSVKLFQDELDNLITHIGLQDKPFDVYGHSWGGMLAVEWAVTSSYSANLRRLILSNSLASMDAWRVGVTTLRKRLPQEVQDALGRAEREGDFESPEYEAAIEVFYKRHLSLARPWPVEEVQAALHWFAKDPTTYGTMYGPSELSITGSLRSWTSIPILSKIKAPTLLINGAEDEAQDVAMQPFFDHIEKVKWVTLDNASHFSHVDQRAKYMEHLRAFLLVQGSSRDATKEEIDSLVHEVAEIPVTAWLLTFTGAASQLARFGVAVAWQNYLQNPPGSSPSPGALGLGQDRASIIQNAFLFFQYLTPLPFAIVSDMWLGRYKTMLLGLLSTHRFQIVGYIVLVLTALPVALDHGAGIGGLATTMVLIGLGHGALSAVMYPLIADQLPESRPKVKTNKDGTLVVTDRKLAIQHVFNGYYWMVNIAALSSIPTTLLEKHVGFWAAYLLPTGILILASIPVLLWNEKIVKLPPEGNALPQAGKILVYACRARFRLSAADPNYQRIHHSRIVPWTSTFVEEIRRGLKGCRVILCFVIFWLCYNQTTNNIISQAGQTEQHGVSNDTIQALNPIACIILGPLIQNLLFPFLRRNRISFGPILRMTVAFLFISAGIAYAAGFQQLIYSRGPCYMYPLECAAAATAVTRRVADADTQIRPNEVNVWVQTPLHFLLATGEILGLVSLNEYTYSEAPSSTKAMVQALQEIAAAVAAALGIALGPVSKNPYLVILYATLAGAMALSAALFYLAFHRYDLAFENDTPTDESNSDEIEPKADEGIKPSHTGSVEPASD